MRTLSGLVAVLALCAASVAQDPAAKAPERAISTGITLEMPSQYFFRGIHQENAGFILQPGFHFDVEAYEGKDTLRSLSVGIGNWNSFHTGDSGTGGANTVDPRAWYESDFYLGVLAQLGDRVLAGVKYTAYTSPNDSFLTVQEASLNVTYDDSVHFNGFNGLQPHAILAFELDNQRLGADEGIYFELGVSPSFDVVVSDWNIRATFPVTLGLSLSDYYQDNNGDDEPYGYLDIGADFSTPVNVGEGRFGDWEVTAGLHALFLGDATEQFNGGDFEFIGTIGLSIGF